MLKKIEYALKQSRGTKKAQTMVALFEDTKISDNEVHKVIYSGQEFHADVLIIPLETFNSVFHSLIHRNRYMLVTVYERELSTTMFETFTEAHNQMEKELKEDFTDEVEWDEFQYQYAEKGDAYRDDCELQKWSAWSNMHNSHTDWWIVEIQLGKEN